MHPSRFHLASVGAILALALLASEIGSAQNTGPMRVLLLTKSSGFEHSSIKRTDDQPSHVERVLAALAKSHGFELETTKDAGRIRADVLAKVDVVVFYTTGDLTQRGGEGTGILAGDGEAPMAKEGLRELLAWIRGGGGFVGFHCASDTFHSEPDKVSEYIAMLGGEFESHGQQFEGLVRVVDPEHPITADAPAEVRRLDEWYVFKNVAPSIHPLRVLDTEDEGERQPLYRRPPYPVVWTHAFGDGRVYYDAQGHREDVWDNREFQDSVVRALRWTAGRDVATTTSSPR